MSGPTLVVLAAGMASRYGGRPKQLEPMGPAGGTLIDYCLHDARAAGFGDAVLVVRPEMESQFRDTIAARWAARLPLRFAHQELPAGRPKPWGTGQAVLTARALVTGPFAVCNADDFYGRSAYRALAEFLAASAPAGPPEWALVGYPLRNTLSAHGGVNRGVCRVGPGGALAGIEEVIDITPSGADGLVRASGRVIPGDTPVSMNIFAFTPALFDALAGGFERFRAARGGEPKAEYLLPAQLEEEIRAGRARMRVLPGGEVWCGVTYPADRAATQEFLAAQTAAGAYPAEPWR